MGGFGERVRLGGLGGDVRSIFWHAELGYLSIWKRRVVGYPLSRNSLNFKKQAEIPSHWTQRCKCTTVSPFPCPNSKPFINSSIVVLPIPVPLSSHNRTRNRNAAAFVPITFNAFRLSSRAALWLDDGADCRGGGGAGTVAVHERVGGGGAHL